MNTGAKLPRRIHRAKPHARLAAPPDGGVYQKGDHERQNVDSTMCEVASGVSKVNHSKYWGVRVGLEREQYGDVRVYTPAGDLVRVIPKETLDRPFPVDNRKNAWNNKVFLPKGDRY